ncbi:unnamed protein product [Rhizophagus irregularis]|nr:unnamed protein product [Rhizophagus irregularis]CAB4401940.1 unnamed protein product [Rhizophagus irregularis]CAB5362869.1 unnamed protein product [Rhizophagus irregularis]
MWNLVNILLQEFDKTNELFLNNNMWKHVNRAQLTAEGVNRLKNCFPDGVIRMRAVYYEDVLKTKPTQPGRSKLGVSKLKVLTHQKELKAKKNKKTTENTQTLESQSQSQLNQQSNTEGSTSQTTSQYNIVAQNESHVIGESAVAELPHKRKRRRIASVEEEALLEPLILSQNEPTNEKMRETLSTLSNEWDLGRIKQHVQYRRKKRVVVNTDNTS